MRRWIALLAAAALVVGAAAVDPCKRQPFRGRCPSVNGQAPRRSQFVLRYYARNGECVSYPYGHCVQDDSEPQLYRYKEECEDHCLQAQEAPGNLGSPKDQGEETYGTIAPILERQPTHAAVNTELPPVVVEQAIEEVETTEEQKTSTTTTTTTTTTTSTASTTTKEPTTTTEKTTTTEEPSTESPSTTTDVTTESTTVSTPEIEATTTTTTTTTTATTTQSTTTKAVSTPDATSTTEHVKSHPRIIEGVKSGIRIQTSSQPTTTGPSTAAPRTECERRRAAAASSKIRGGFVPACESDGRFKKVQCEPDGRQCFCVGDNGIEIANSRTKNGLQPNCHMIETAPRPHIKECTGGFNGGPCSSAITRWYYSEQDQKCKKFTFSGCGGNGNNYESESECLQRCAPPSGLPRCEKGEPLKTTQGAPVNCAKQECPSGYRCSVVQHSSVCCPENNKIIGQQTSELAGVCRLSKEHGPCEKYELRFYYNADLNECKYFFYGGCDGNGNNFVTVEDCKRTCGIAQSGATRSPTPRTTQGIRITPEALTSSTTPEPSTEPSTSHQTQAATTRRTPQTVPTHPTTRRVTHSAPTTTTEEPTTHRRAETTRAEHRTAFNSHTSTQAPVIHIQQQRPFNVPPLPHGDLTPGSAEDMLPDSANRCSHPQDAGSCRGQFIRWYWDSEKKFCDVFTYSGCEGNGNNFASREECLALCHREVTQSVTPDFSNVCEHEVDAGECNGVFQRFAFDSEAGECRPFTYGGCGGNGNNFATMAECRAKCQRVSTQPINLCEHDIEAGECTGVFPRFGYDRETNDCRQFTYGGCGGNGNNFASMAECRNVCIKKACNPSPQCDLSRCQIVNDSTGCPFCSCAPIRQPIPSTQCPPVDVSRCQEPCMVINNRRGCQECACPKSPNSPIPPVLLPPQGHPEEAGPPASSRQSSSASRVVGPPAEPTHVAPPAPRAHAAEPIEPVHKIDLSKNDLERPQLPNKLNLDLQEKCFQPMEAGPCKNFVDRWYFNSEDGTCHPFKYGGCAGNRNHFFTQKECEIHCARFLRAVSNDLTSHAHDSWHNGNWVYHEEVAHKLTTQAPFTNSVHHTSPRPTTSQLPFEIPSSVRARAKAGPTIDDSRDKLSWKDTYEAQTSTPSSSSRRFPATNHLLKAKEESTIRESVRPNTVNPSHRLQPLSPPRRQESVRVETVASPIPIQTRQHGSITSTYDMNSITSYNPQINPNLEGLSPPVDPTYFTYNSQHLGQRRQFAVNNVPFDKNQPITVPHTFVPNGGQRIVQQRQFPQQRSFVQSVQQNRPVPQNNAQHTPIRNQPLFNQQVQHVNPLAVQQQWPRQLLAPVRGQQNSRVSTSPPTTRVYQSDAERRFEQAVEAVEIEEPTARPTTTRKLHDHSTPPPSWHNIHQAQTWTAPPNVQKVISNHARAHQEAIVLSRDTNSRQFISGSTTNAVRSGQHVTPAVPAYTGAVRSSIRQQAARTFENAISPPEHIRNAVQILSANAHASPASAHPTTKLRASVTTTRAPVRPLPTAAVIPTVDNRADQFGRNPLPTVKKQSEFKKFPTQKSTSQPKAHTATTTSLPRAPKRLQYHELETALSRNHEAHSLPKLLRIPIAQAPRQLYGSNLYDQTQWIYYEGDYYGPVIPGIRINRTDYDLVDGTVAVPNDAPLEALETFAPQARQFQETALQYIKGSRSNTNIRGESSEQSEEDEPRLLSSHHRAAGVTQVKMSEPLPVENYNSPNPPLRSKAVAAAAPEAGRRPLVPLPLPPHGFEAFPPGFDRLITTQGVKITPRTSTTTTATTTTTTSTTTSTTSPTTSRQPVTTTKRDVFETEPTTDSTAVTESTTNVKQTSPVHDDVSSTDASLPTQPSHVPLSTILSASTSHDSLEEDGLFTEITDSNTPHSSESPSSTLVPPMETTLVNEVDDMGDDEHIENEVEDFEKKMKPSSKFNNQAVQRETEEEEIFDEAELTTVAVSTTVKADEVKAATLKKIEISRTTKAPTTREPSTSSTPSTSVDEEAQESEFAVSDDSDEEHEADADIEQTPEAPTKSLSTTNAPAQSDITTAYTTTEVEETPSTQVAESETTSVAAPITRFASSTSAENSSTTSETTTQPITDAKVAGITQFEPATEEEVIDVNSVGREPVPSSPVGIGRIAENLDIDDLGELEEPTTIVPTTQKTTATSTPAVTRISSKAPVTSATTAAGRITTVGLVNSASTHIVRHDVFDAQIICNQAPDVGLCRNFMTRWFYNAQTARCEQFSFGSCGGNLNNFADRETCELRCMSGGAQPVLQSQVPERCTFSSDSGFGKEYHPKWYFNMRNLRCERFVYFGQGGNVNHFETLGDCERVCTPQPIHSLTDEQTKNPNIIQTTNPTTRATAPTKATSASTKATQPTPPPRTLPPTPSTEAKTHSLRPLPEQSLPVPTIDDNAENIGDDVEYDSTELEDQNLLPQLPEETRALPTLATARPIAPIPPQELPGAAPPASEPRPPSANAAKTITQEEVEAESLKTTSQPKTTYKAEPLPAEGTPLSGEHLPIVAPSPKQQVDYQTGQRNIVHGISNFHDGRISASDILDVDEFDGKSNLPACPNNGKELRYTDGRPIMCLPGKNQCPDQSVCYFNGVDYFCCPTVEDPYDKHVFGGYGGEEVRNGYKVFGPLRVRRLMDDVPLREKRQTSMDRAFQTNPVSFNLDSVVAPLRFDAEKPRTVSRASRMRKPRPPHHGNPMCILPLVKGECKEAHLRYYYDVPSDSCRLFYYSGCQGNANNFGSLEDCQRLCVLANQPQTHIEAAAVVSSEPVLPPGKCPSGSPLGGASPVLCGNSTDSIGCPSGYYCRSGPPDICCPGEEPVATPGPVQQGVRSFPVSSSDRISVGTPRQYNKDALLSTPKDICPDASDPLIDENGQPLICGAGFDGMSMCPKGFYCAIDAEKNSRLCCPLYGAAQRIPTETVSAPYFGKRVVEKESMTTSEPVDSQEHEEFLDSEEEYEDEEDEDAPQHIMVKSDSRHQALQHAAASESPKAVSIENETVSIDVPTEAPAPEADETTSLKPTDDKSICQLKPTEGRPCRSDEKPPRTNLHFFYSAKDNRCKLYFYRGCGGNENRFEKKADCEARCLVRS